MMRTHGNTHALRRRLIKTLAALPLLSPFRLSAAKAAGQSSSSQNIPTPWQTPGPFYPEQPIARDANLLTTSERAEPAKGEKLLLQGDVVTRNGQPLSQATVEIWQCDSTGHYHHPADPQRGRRDNNFQGYGRTQTDNNGRYEFHTIVPVPYPGRTPHIHVAVMAPSYQRLTTQLYIADRISNDDDVLYRRLSAAQQRALTVKLVSTEHYEAKQAFFRITLA